MSHTMTDMTPTLPPLGPLPEPSFKEAPAFLPNSASTAPYEGPVYPAMFTAEQMQSYATEYGEQCARAAVPEGWVLVPKEPTPEMLEAYYEVGRHYQSGKADWKAMLSAAPAAPGPQAVAKAAPLKSGYQRQWVKCRTCGHVAYYDFVPYSLSSPIMTMPCGHGSGERDMGADRISEEEAQAQQASAQPTQAAKDVLAERQRQISVEGWTPEHDDNHGTEEMAFAASCYATADEDDAPPAVWPWHWSWWKPRDRRRNLVKAGALILAEIERLDRASNTGQEKS